MSAVATTLRQSRPIDRRPVWILFAAVVLASATVLAVTLVNRQDSSPSVGSTAVSTSVDGHFAVGPAGGLTAYGDQLVSTRPLSDAAYEIPAVRESIPTMRVFSDSKYDFRDLRIQSTRPLSDGSLGGPPAGSATNENAQVVPNCHQCR